MNRLPLRAGRPRDALLLLLSVSGLGGCAVLPSSGPTAREITAVSREPGHSLAFTILDLTPDLLDRMAAPELSNGGGASLPPARSADVIGPGDTIQVSIFEIGASLFSGKSTAASPAPGSPPVSVGEALPAIPVAADGSATIPYAGRMQAAGLTPDALAARIQAALAGKSQAPQVVVTVRDNVAETVMVLGDVKKPGRFPLTLSHERVLDAVALAGGPANVLQDEWVHLRRESVDRTFSLDAVRAGDVEDAALSPQDRIEVIYQPRSFTIFGATGKVSEVPFQTPHVTLAEAVARAGGPADQFADPRAVFVFRFDKTGPDGVPLADAKPVAYRLDLMQAQSYFLAQRFEMRRRDVVYIANAASNQPTKFLQILNLFFQPFYTAKVVSQ